MLSNGRRYLWLHPRATLAALAALCSAHALAALLIAAPQPGVHFDRAWCVLVFGVGAAILIVKASHWAAVLGLCASGYANGMLRSAGYTVELLGEKWNGALPIESLLAAVLWLIAAQLPGRIESRLLLWLIAGASVASLSLAGATLLGTFEGVPWLLLVPLSVGAIACCWWRGRRRMSAPSRIALAFLVVPAVYLVLYLLTGEALGGEQGAATTNVVFSMMVPMLVSTIPSERREGNGRRENGPGRAAVVG